MRGMQVRTLLGLIVAALLVRCVASSPEVSAPRQPPIVTVSTPVASQVTAVTVAAHRATPAFVELDATLAEPPPTIEPRGMTIEEDYVRYLPVPGRTFEAVLGAAAGEPGNPIGDPEPFSLSSHCGLENTYVIEE